MKKIAVYGSLKKGAYNYRESMGEPIGHSTVRGSMFLASSYPVLYPPERSNPELVRIHAIELYEISDESYQSIHSMEIGAGYEAVEMGFTDEDGKGHVAVIFFMRGDGSKATRPFLEEYSANTVPHAYGVYR